MVGASRSAESRESATRLDGHPARRGQHRAISRARVRLLILSKQILRIEPRRPGPCFRPAPIYVRRVAGRHWAASRWPSRGAQQSRIVRGDDHCTSAVKRPRDQRIDISAAKILHKVNTQKRLRFHPSGSAGIDPPQQRAPNQIAIEQPQSSSRCPQDMEAVACVGLASSRDGFRASPSTVISSMKHVQNTLFVCRGARRRHGASTPGPAIAFRSFAGAQVAPITSSKLFSCRCTRRCSRRAAFASSMRPAAFVSRIRRSARPLYRACSCFPISKPESSRIILQPE